MKSYVYIVAWLILIVVASCEVRIVLFTQMMAVVKRYPVQVFLSIRISIPKG